MDQERQTTQIARRVIDLRHKVDIILKELDVSKAE